MVDTNSEKLYKEIFENASEGIFQTSVDGKFLTVNPAMVRMLGYDDADDFLECINSLTTPLYVNHEDRIIIYQTLSSQGSVSGFDTQLRRKNTSTMWFSLNAHQVKDDNGKVVCVQGSIMDITMRKQAEAEVRAAKEEAEAASRMKSDLLASVSHELLTPLTSMLGFAKMAEKKLLHNVAPRIGLKNDTLVFQSIDKMRGNLSIIASEGERLTQLIRNVIDLTELEAQTFEMNTETISALDFIEPAIDEARPHALQKHLQLSIEVTPNLPYVQGDKGKLRQVMANLLSNAIKFSEKGEIICSAYVENDQLFVAVEDMGYGIPPNVQDKVFDKFYQLGDVLTNKPPGLGLGLSISKLIVELHGGKIWVDSDPEEGSVFSFSLPII